MGLFDKLDSQEEDEEVTLRAPETDASETKLEEEVEESLIDESEDNDTSSSSSGSSMLPGMNSTSREAGSAGGVELEDIHEQNKKIIELLKDINSGGRI